MKTIERLESFDQLYALHTRNNEETGGYKYTITACSGTGCSASDSVAVCEALQEEIERQGMGNTVRLTRTGCHGFCEQGPLVVIEPGNILYCKVSTADAASIVSSTAEEGKVLEDLLYTDPISAERKVKEQEISFYQKQQRLLLGRNKLVDPTDIYKYIAIGGYQSLAKVLSSMKPDEVIAEIKESGLRGRGGGGFPTGVKWESCRKVQDEPKYIICNADEGDPGAYMDRSLLEGNPHSVIEGMIIGAFAVGSNNGFIYVRNEYPLALKNSQVAIEQAERMGLLGADILGSGFSFEIKIVRGGGAFVCGESTALMASLEGKVGEPRSKITHTVEKGYMSKPSTLNNVETWANVPLIMQHGSGWFSDIGTEKSKGTKIFALTGKIKNTGLVEVAMGTTLNEIVNDIGGGALNGKKIKAVQTGGPSGGCIPESLFDLKVDFDELYQAGSMMGSGGIVVLDQGSCMVDVAKFFLNFVLDESCGKCSTCRIGTSRMLEILEDITAGRGTLEQLKLLEDTAETVCYASLCALGKTAPNPVLSTLKYFREEYLAHIEDKKCPAKVCRDLIHYTIDVNNCTGCQACSKACPAGAIEGERKAPHAIDQSLCTKCGICEGKCRFNAVLVA